MPLVHRVAIVNEKGDVKGYLRVAVQAVTGKFFFLVIYLAIDDSHISLWLLAYFFSYYFIIKTGASLVPWLTWNKLFFFVFFCSEKENSQYQNPTSITPEKSFWNKDEISLLNLLSVFWFIHFSTYFFLHPVTIKPESLNSEKVTCHGLSLDNSLCRSRVYYES